MAPYSLLSGFQPNEVYREGRKEGNYEYIKKLDLEYRISKHRPFGLTDKDVKFLMIDLRYSKNLKILNLSNNAIGVSGAGHVAKAVCQANFHLEVLDISDNIDIQDEGAKHLSSALIKNTSLQALSLRHCDIGEIGAKAISEMLQSNNELQELSLCLNSFGSAGAISLFNALGQNDSSRLQRLRLSQTEIGDDACFALRRMLEVNESLETINLAYNAIGDDGAVQIAIGLERNINVQTLILSGNNIGYEGACAIGRALSINTTLKSLVIRGNRFGKCSMAEIANGMVKNTTLTRLKLTTDGSNSAAVTEKINIQLKANRECKPDADPAKSSSARAVSPRTVARQESEKLCNILQDRINVLQ